MLPYWVLFGTVASLALTSDRRSAQVRTDRWIWVGALLTCFIGFRVKVGGDWGSYLGWFERSSAITEVSELLTTSDPGYVALNVMSAWLGQDIYLVNLLCGAIFTWGLLTFCRTLDRPFLALVVAVPYLVTVVAMGYTRQGVALGLVMAALVAHGKGQGVRYAALVLLGATFHKTAVIIIPVIALAGAKNRKQVFLWGSVAAVVGYVTLLQDALDAMQRNYLEAQYQSQGAQIRTAMNLVPAALLLWARPRFAVEGGHLRIWLWLTGLSIVTFVMTLVSAATTAVDRIALYLLPLQLWVFARLPTALSDNAAEQAEIAALIVIYYAAVFFVWLHYADHARYWLPYRFYPLELAR